MTTTRGRKKRTSALGFSNMSYLVGYVVHRNSKKEEINFNMKNEGNEKEESECVLIFAVSPAQFNILNFCLPEHNFTSCFTTSTI